MSVGSAGISAAILILAFFLRIWLLDLKPAHFDEGVNGWFVDQMTRQGFYHYDPTNFHGPFHFYVLFVAQTLLGRSTWALRLPIALMSTVCVGMVLAFRRYLDERACQVAALMMAISPAMVFYGRYAIHETWLMFFLLLIAWGLLGLGRSGGRGDLWAVAMGVTGMIVTKETYVVHLVAFALAVPCLMGYEALTSQDAPSPLEPPGGWKISRSDWFAVAGVSLGLILFFYSGGFLDWPGPQTYDDAGHPIARGSLCGLWETFGTWFQTGMGASGHEKPFLYWLDLMRQYEWPALGGLAAGFWLLFPRVPREARYVAIYGLGALIGYSIIRYKTPWCVISLMWPFYLILGLAVVRLADWLDRWVIHGFAALAVLGSLGLTIQLNRYNYDDENVPYVYVQTFRDVDLLLKPLQALARRDARNYQLRGRLLLAEQYPWLWTLGAFPRVEISDPAELPDPLDADFLVVDSKRVEDAEPMLRLEYYKLPMRIRGNTGDSPASLYLYTGTFAGLVPADTPIFVPGQTETETPPAKPDAQ